MEPEPWVSVTWSGPFGGDTPSLHPPATAGAARMGITFHSSRPVPGGHQALHICTTNGLTSIVPQSQSETCIFKHGDIWKVQKKQKHKNPLSAPPREQQLPGHVLNFLYGPSTHVTINLTEPGWCGLGFRTYWVAGRTF